ncbi:MAG: helix-turn-helix transcriptional regulator [Bacteroidetes bacterium]|nr:helix-turn-helix transcriptional regulator [Bacteroidota bacterium]
MSANLLDPVSTVLRLNKNIPDRIWKRIFLQKILKEMRKALKHTQTELASKADVGLRFVRELERGKNTLRMDKVNQVMQLFGMEPRPIEISGQNYS